MKHVIKTDSMFFVSILLHKTRRNQYKWGENIAKTGNICNYILHVCGKNINKKTTYQFCERTLDLF